MLPDRLWRGAFHRHIMTIGGRTATPARTAQLDSEFRFPARPAINTAEIQTVARTASSDTSCMSEEYAPALNGAVPECTHRPQRSDRGLRRPILLLAVAAGDSVHALDALCTSAQTGGLWKCKHSDTLREA